ncbi:MAG: hypothetical protein DRI01_05530 [Chloroflexi bacterium]|nr:MAG: hypothetical protein DRI01_05530 [Chloroflexota bacterium]
MTRILPLPRTGAPAAAAILDRLLHHGTVINIRGKSYRLRDKLQAGTVAGPITPSQEKTEEERQ